MSDVLVESRTSKIFKTPKGMQHAVNGVSFRSAGA
jgi:hypothetical protein